MNINIDQINFDKLGGLIPAVVQDCESMQILMVGFMNREAIEQTIKAKRVTFFSRSKGRIWVKGEASGNYLSLINLALDCDNDSLLIYAKPTGPTCHKGDMSCFKTEQPTISKLIKIIDSRYENPQENSYVTKLFSEGTKRIAQKVGEEGVEVALAAAVGDNEELANETADLLFHLLVLLRQQGLDFSVITDVLEKRIGKIEKHKS